MSNVLLILGNGPTKRITICGYATQKLETEKDIVWYCFSSEEQDDVVEQIEDYDFSAPIPSPNKIDYVIADLSRCKEDEYGCKRRRKAFDARWERSMERVQNGAVDIVILEELDGALDLGWLKMEDVLQLIGRSNVKEFIITGNYLPAGILGAANKLVEIWEREN